MILEIGYKEIQDGLIKQLNSFFRVTTDEENSLNKVLQEVLDRCNICFSNTKNKYYRKNGEVYFNPYHSGQYTIFLYYLSNTLFKKNFANNTLADKVYYLNKIMNSCDLFYEIMLPDVFMLDHPVGSVMGRADYGKNFYFGQNCTVGNNKGMYPKIGNNVYMLANSIVLGSCKIGNNVIIAAETYIKDQDIPDNCIVFGKSPDLTIKYRS